MKCEQIVEEFLKLVSQEKIEQAEKLVVKEAKGRENELAGSLLAIGVEIGNRGDFLIALHCFEAAEKAVKSENLKAVIMQNLAIVHNNYCILLKDMKRFEEAENHYKKSSKNKP